MVHSSGTVVATCSGQRSRSGLAEDDKSSVADLEDKKSDDISCQSTESTAQTPDNSIKVWSL